MPRSAFQTRIQIGLDGDKWKKTIAQLRAGARPVNPVVAHLQNEIVKLIKRNFQLGGLPSWRNLSRNTVAAKGNDRILGGGRSKIAMGTKASALLVAGSGADRTITGGIFVPFPGLLHHQGTHPYTIKPKHGGMLRFVVAEDAKDFRARRRRALARRRAGDQKARVPASPGKKIVYARRVKHPGLPKRPLYTLTDRFLEQAWRLPLVNYLFKGVPPT